MDDRKPLRSDSWFNDQTIRVRPLSTWSATAITASPGRASIRPADYRHCAKRQRPRPLQPDSCFAWLSESKPASAMPAGYPFEFPTYPIQETGRRPTAALDRNLAYLALVELLHGYPFDGVVLTTGCDKTTPSALMAAATVNLPRLCCRAAPCSMVM